MIHPPMPHRSGQCPLWPTWIARRERHLIRVDSNHGRSVDRSRFGGGPRGGVGGGVCCRLGRGPAADSGVDDAAPMVADGGCADRSVPGTTPRPQAETTGRRRRRAAKRLATATVAVGLAVAARRSEAEPQADTPPTGGARNAGGVAESIVTAGGTRSLVGQAQSRPGGGRGGEVKSS